jgi:hypothetical protein
LIQRFEIDPLDAYELQPPREKPVLRAGLTYSMVVPGRSSPWCTYRKDVTLAHPGAAKYLDVVENSDFEPRLKIYLLLLAPRVEARPLHVVRP